jgi:hypothetical protein
MDVRYYSMLCTSLVGVFCDVVDVVGNVRFPNFTIEEVCCLCVYNGCRLKMNPHTEMRLSRSSKFDARSDLFSLAYDR